MITFPYETRHGLGTTLKSTFFQIKFLFSLVPLQCLQIVGHTHHLWKISVSNLLCHYQKLEVLSVVLIEHLNTVIQKSVSLILHSIFQRFTFILRVIFQIITRWNQQLPEAQAISKSKEREKEFITTQPSNMVLGFTPPEQIFKTYNHPWTKHDDQ